MSHAACAFDLLPSCTPPAATVLDVGAGEEHHAGRLRDLGYDVTAWHLAQWGPVEEGARPGQWDVVWCSHVLEHTYAPIRALANLAAMTRPGGLLCVIVPPRKDEIVGGHVSLYVPGLLLYQAVLAGIDLTRCALRVSGYDIALMVRDPKLTALPELLRDNGDIERLAHRFPPWMQPVRHGFDGQLGTRAWGPL